MASMSDAERAAAEHFMAAQVKRMTNVQLYTALRTYQNYLDRYPGHESALLQYTITQTEIDAREDAYLAWLEKGMPHA